MKGPRQISDEERARRSARMRANLGDPAFVARILAGKAACWTPERRAAQAAVMERLRADPSFQDKRRRARRLAVPSHTHPLVRGLFVELNLQQAYINQVTRRAGLGDGTIRQWHRNIPGVDLLDAALNVLDLEIAIVPIGSRDENGFVKFKPRHVRTGAEP